MASSCKYRTFVSFAHIWVARKAPFVSIPLDKLPPWSFGKNLKQEKSNNESVFIKLPVLERSLLCSYYKVGVVSSAQSDIKQPFRPEIP